MSVWQGVDSEHLKVCPHDQKYYALEPIDTDQFFFFCDSMSSESDSILGSYYAKRYATTIHIPSLLPISFSEALGRGSQSPPPHFFITHFPAANVAMVNLHFKP